MDFPCWLTDPTTRTRLIGYSPWTPRQLLTAVLDGHSIAELPGDFVLVAERTPVNGPAEHLIVTSVVSVLPYFVVDQPGPALHGTDVFELVDRAGLPWSWDLDALRALAWLGHTIADQSLHPRVRRVPPASVLRHGGKRWTRWTDPYWQQVFNGPHTTLDQAVDIFDLVTDEMLAGVGQPPQAATLIPLSAGFDSRALLARALATGSRPETATMGFPDSTDMVVAQDIAGTFGLPHQTIRLHPEQYFRHASAIVRLTGGAKTVAHWHAYLYTARLPGGRQLLNGTHGGFARSYYLDKGLPARLVTQARGFSIYAYWVAKISRRYRRMAPLQPLLAPRGVRDVLRFAELVTSLGGSGDGLEVLDRFFANHRVRHFIGNGLALTAAHGHPVSPFLDARWITAVAGLSRADKIGSNLHRRIIERNLPALLRHPVCGEQPVAPRAPHGYWWRRAAPVVPYSPAPEVLGGPTATAILRDSPHLTAFIDDRQRPGLATATEVARELLLTLHFAGTVAATVDRTPR